MARLHFAGGDLCLVASEGLIEEDNNMWAEKGRSAVGILIVLLLGFGFGSTELNGQIGGLMKKKMKQIVQPDSDRNSEDTSEESDNEQTPRFNENVLELNAENVARLEKALACEKEFRNGVEAKYAKLPTSEQHQNCVMQVLMSPEAEAISEGIKEGDMQSVQQVGEKMIALQEQKCGKDPEILISSKDQELRPSGEEGAKCAGFTSLQYAIAMERIAPFCGSGGQAQVKGYGEAYYVYTPVEMSAIQPECARLTGLISDLSEPAKK